MNRFAKTFRVLASLCVLFNMASLFVPVIRRVQDNYADLTWTQIDYIRGMLSTFIPSLAEGAQEVTESQSVWVLGFMVLPAAVSLTAGVWGIVGSQVQKISSMLVTMVFLLYVGMAATIDCLWPQAAAGQAFCRGFACVVVLVCSGLGTLFSVAALFATPRKVKAIRGEIPQVEEVKEQVEAKYHILAEEEPKLEKKTQEAAQETPAHGVLVGLSGVYAGAEISIADGTEILLGRHSHNHLVFEGQGNISRDHCKIRWDEACQKYIFHDYSCNGSFIKGEENCLPQNLDIQLAPGTTIMLGNENNIFYLK